MFLKACIIAFLNYHFLHSKLFFVVLHPLHGDVFRDKLEELRGPTHVLFCDASPLVLLARGHGQRGVLVPVGESAIGLRPTGAILQPYVLLLKQFVVCLVVAIDGGGVGGLLVEDVDEGLGVVVGALAVVASPVFGQALVDLALLVKHVQDCESIEAI